MIDTPPPPPRKAGPRDFAVDVDGVGRFVFGYRTFADQFAIEVEFARLTKAVDPTSWLRTVGEWMATLRVLLVQAPAGFDLDDIDPLDDGVYQRIGSVFAALRDKEDSFRQRTKAGSQGGGQGSGAAGDLLVSPQVQPVAPGSAVSGNDDGGHMGGVLGAPVR